MRARDHVELPPLTYAELKLPDVPRNGVLSHHTAAAIHRYPLIATRTPALTLPVGFHARGCAGWQVHWSALAPGDLTVTADGVAVTSQRRTAIDCGLTLPLQQGVAVLDSALNRGIWQRAELVAFAAAARGRRSGALKKAVSWSDGRAESAQESVGRVALREAGLPAEPQFALFAGAYEHHFDLALRWARLVVDLQSRAHHSQWAQVERDIGYLETVNLVRGWKLALTLPAQVLPDPTRFVRSILGIVVTQPGQRSGRLRRRYVNADGVLTWPYSAVR